MRLLIRASASPAREPPDFLPSLFVRTGSTVALQAEASTGSTLAIQSRSDVAIEPEFGLVIESRSVVSLAPGIGLRITSGSQMTVTAAASDFGFTRDLVLAGQEDLANETLTDFVLIGQAFTDNAFRTEGNGGRVTDADGDDIRFTDQSTNVLSHNLVTYGASTGAIFYDMKIPTYPVRSDFRHRLLYANAAISSPLEDPAACFSRTAAAWLWTAGTDFSGRGRDLTVTGVTSGTLKGPAGVFAGTSSRAVLTGPTWAAVANCAVEFWIRPTAIGRIFRIGSPSAGDNPGIDIRIRDEETAWGITKRTAGGIQFSQGSVAFGTFGEDYHVFAVIRDGQNSEIWVNGVSIPLTHTTDGGGAQPPLSGPVIALPTDELAIGDPTTTTRNGFSGTLGRVIFWPFAPSAAWIVASYRFQADQAATLGISAENVAGAANRGPVAVPFPGAAVAGQAADFDVAVRSFDPNSDLLTASVPTPPTQGTSSIVANKVRYTPNGGTGGQTHSVPFRVSDAAKSSDSIIRVSVSAPPAPTPEYPNPLRTFTVDTAAELLDTINRTTGSFLNGVEAPIGQTRTAPLQPGDHVIMRGTAVSPINYGGGYNLTQAGTQAAPIVFRAENVGGARFTGTFDWQTAAAHNVLHGAAFDGNQAAITMRGLRSALVRVRVLNVLRGGAGGVVDVRADDPSILFCEFGVINLKVVRCRNDPQTGGVRSLRPTIFRSYWHDSNIHTAGQSNEAIQFGLTDGPNNVMSNYPLQGIARECYFLRWQKLDGSSDNEVISNKSSDNLIDRCTLEQSRNFALRHGARCRIISCRSFNGSDGIYVYGSDHVVGGCTVSTDAGQILLKHGHHYQEDGPTADGNRASARRCRVDSCTGRLHVGHPGAIGTPVNAIDNVIRNHSGNITTQRDYSFETSRDSSYREIDTTYFAAPETPGEFPALVTLNAANTGPGAPWMEPPRGYGKL